MINTEKYFFCFYTFIFQVMTPIKMKNQKKKKAKRGTVKALCILKWVGSVCLDNKQLSIPSYFKWSYEA